MTKEQIQELEEQAKHVENLRTRWVLGETAESETSSWNYLSARHDYTDALTDAAPYLIDCAKKLQVAEGKLEKAKEAIRDTVDYGENRSALVKCLSALEEE